MRECPGPIAYNSQAQIDIRQGFSSQCQHMTKLTLLFLQNEKTKTKGRNTGFYHAEFIPFERPSFDSDSNFSLWLKFPFLK